MKKENLLIVGSGAIGLLWYSHINIEIKKLAVNNPIKKANLPTPNEPLINCYLYQSSTRKKLPNIIQLMTINNKKVRLPSNILTANTIEPIDIILFCVKSYQLNQAIAETKHLITKSTVVILSHNGLGTLHSQSNQDLHSNIVLDLLTTQACLKLADNALDEAVDDLIDNVEGAIFDSSALINTSINTSINEAKANEPATNETITKSTIKHTGLGVSYLGIKNRQGNLYHTASQINTIHLKHITQLLNMALPEVIWCEDMLEKQWLKLAINCVINPITTLHNINNGEILAERFTKTIAQLIEEIVAIALLNKVVLNKTSLKNTVRLVAEKTANNSSSMRCDVLQGRKTEIEYINGYIHTLGQQFNIATPKNTELYYKVLAL